MNQDFTVKEKQYLSEKNFVQRGSLKKKNPAQAVSEKKKKKGSCRLKILPPSHPIIFLMVRPLLFVFRLKGT